jgi:hypothetical protein
MLTNLIAQLVPSSSTHAPGFLLKSPTIVLSLFALETSETEEQALFWSADFVLTPN